MDNIYGLHPEWISFSQIKNDSWPVKSRWQRKRVVRNSRVDVRKEKVYL